MTAIDSALKTIEQERLKDHSNYIPPVYVFRTLNERNATDPFNYGYEMFLLGIAKGRRMEKAAQKANKCNDVERQCYIDAIVRLLKRADLHKVDLVWTYASHLIKEAAEHDK